MKRQVKGFNSIVFILLVGLVLLGCESPTGPAADQALRASELETASGEAAHAALAVEMEALEADLEGGLSALAKQGNVVEVPPGSEDALTAAIAQAGSGGTVLLRSGMHTESGTVEIRKRVNIVGESGAVLEVNTGSWPDLRDYVEPALHVRNTSKVIIWRVDIRPPEGQDGGVAILVESSPQTVIGKTGLYNHQFGIIVQGGDHAKIWKNTVVTTDTRWPDAFNPVGIVVSVGGQVKIAENDVSNAFTGIFVSDDKGLLSRNKSHENAFAGVIFCKWGPPFPGPGGTIIEAEFSATRWLATRNNAHDNLVGYLLLDGANRNLLVNNAASNNGPPFHDIELFGANDSQPTTFENHVVAGRYPEITIRDCGVDNNIDGGNQISCF